MNTKERILLEALRLFARKGYEAVSVADIAESIGMTKGALYKHYKNKRDILDSIINRMKEKDAERAKEYEVPEESIENNVDQYEKTSIKEMTTFLEAQFEYWTEDEFASKFRQMLTIEQYVNGEMNQLFQDYLSGGVVDYINEFFLRKQVKGGIHTTDTKSLAIKFYSGAFLMMNLYDASNEKDKMKVILHEQMKEFIKKHGKEL